MMGHNDGCPVHGTGHTDTTPLGDQLVLAERHRILRLADELQRHGKLTADNLRFFAEMRLQVMEPTISVSHEGDTTTVEVKQDVALSKGDPVFVTGQHVLVDDDASNQPIPKNWPQWKDVPCRVDVHNPSEDARQRMGGRHYCVYAIDSAAHGRAGRWVSAEQMRPYILVGGDA